MFDFIHFWSFLLFTVYKELYFHADYYQNKNSQIRESIKQLRHCTRWFPCITISSILFMLAITHEQLSLDRDLQFILLCLILVCRTDKYRLYLTTFISIISLCLEIIIHYNDSKLVALLHVPTMFMVHVYLTSLRMDFGWITGHLKRKPDMLRAKYSFQVLYEMRLNRLMIVFAVGQQMLAFHLWYFNIVRSILVLSFQFVLITSYILALIWNYILCKDPNQLLLIPFIKNQFPDNHPFWAQFVTCLHSILVISLIVTLIVA
ncbi:hypothetical protein I4U23_015187 [Adineta vaga]|nr:hypothetical protein I4U23_015187 [Adineta vaga]